LTALVVTLPCFAARQAAPPAELLFFALKGDIDRERVDEALSDEGARLERPPAKSSGRPQDHFVVVRAPLDVDARRLERALKKSRCKVEPLEWIRFTGRTGDEHELPTVAGLEPRDHLIGSHGDVRWYESGPDWAQFYVVKGRLEADDLRKRYETLFQPFGGAQLGVVDEQTFEWDLVTALEKRAAKKLDKELSKLAGVRDVRLDPDGKRLTVLVECYRLRRSAAPSKANSGDVRLALPVERLIAVLDEHGVEHSKSTAD